MKIVIGFFGGKFALNRNCFRMSKSASLKKPISETVPDIICNKCNITFGKRYSLNAHMRKFHAEEKLSLTGNQICGMCKEGFRTTPELHEHLQSQHNINLNFVEETFYTESDFQQWKDEIERDHQSSFILKCSWDNKETSIKHFYYKCHRSGVPNLKSDRKRHMKASGSIKTGVTCPATIKVTTQTIDGITEIKVQYQSVHVGHDLEVGTLRLCKEDRENLAESLRVGVPLSKILDEARAAYSPTKRLGFTTRQDLYNIRRDFNINSRVVMHSDDSTSVDIGSPQGWTNTAGKVSLQFHKLCQQIDSEEVDRFIVNQLKRLTAYVQSAATGRSSLPTLLDRSKAPPIKLVDKQRKFIIKKKKKACAKKP